jgi:hypothetical protein
LLRLEQRLSDTRLVSSTRPFIAATASGTGTRVASPSAPVAAFSVSTGLPARQDSII